MRRTRSKRAAMPGPTARSSASAPPPRATSTTSATSLASSTSSAPTRSRSTSAGRLRTGPCKRSSAAVTSCGCPPTSATTWTTSSSSSTTSATASESGTGTRWRMCSIRPRSVHWTSTTTGWRTPSRFGSATVPVGCSKSRSGHGRAGPKASSVHCFSSGKRARSSACGSPSPAPPIATISSCGSSSICARRCGRDATGCPSSRTWRSRARFRGSISRSRP